MYHQLNEFAYVLFCLQIKIRLHVTTNTKVSCVPRVNGIFFYEFFFMKGRTLITLRKISNNVNIKSAVSTNMTLNVFRTFFLI